MNSNTSNRQVVSFIRAVFVCFFISGTAGLIYQILWVRMLGLIFGHTVYAITTVLVVFMGGLALGSYLCGRVADRIQNLLRLYGVIEIGVGGYCLFIPWMMEWVQRTYLFISGAVDLSPIAFTLIQFILVSIVLLLPTTLMGATLPILSRFFVRNLDSVGQRVGKLYACNTLGAVFGTYLAGFELLPVLGMQLTLFFAATLNIGAGIIIFLLDQRQKPLLKHVQEALSKPRVTPIAKTVYSFRSRDVLVCLLMIGLALSGAASMIYEIAWTRALSLVIGSTIYAYSAMLLSFLVGIAAGSAFISRLAGRHTISWAWFSGLQLAIGLSAAAVLPFFDRLPDIFLFAFRFSQSHSFILFLQVGISFGVMILPTFFIGATFPCAIQVVSRNLSHVGYEVGRVYAYNTAGAILGSFLAGFVLIPAIGLQASIKVAIIVNLLVGWVILSYGSPGRRLRAAAIAGIFVTILGVWVLPAWDQKAMNSGVAIYAPVYKLEHPGKPLGGSFRDEKILYYKEGISSTVSVHQKNKGIYLKLNGKTDASNGRDMKTQLMLGHLPALLHPDPRTALVIGVGSGVTIGALTTYNLKQIDVVEIEPAVIEAAAFFNKENRNALEDPSVNILIGDGRNALLTAKENYDLIISEPTNLWIGGTATLFTVEFFEIARRKLNPNGLMVQWIHGYGISSEDVRMVAASFRLVFPNAALWLTDKADYLLIGGIQAVVLDLDRLRDIYRTHSSFREDMERIKMLSPEAILGDFYLNSEDLGRLTAGAELNTDDLLPLEFSAPRSLYEDTINTNIFVLRKAKHSRYPSLKGDSIEKLEQADIQYHLAMNYMDKKMPKEVMDYLNAALRTDPEHIPARFQRGRLMIRYNRVLEATEDLERILKINPEFAEAHYQLGFLFLKENQPDRAIEYIQRAVSIEPGNAAYLVGLAAAFRRNQLYNDAVAQYRLALKLQPRNQRIMGALAATLIQLEQAADAITILDRAILINPEDHRLHYQRGRAYLLQGMIREARKAFEDSTKINPSDPEPYVGLGKVWLALGDRDKAVNYFREATSINPGISIPEV